LSTRYHLNREFAAVCRKIATFCSVLSQPTTRLLFIARRRCRQWRPSVVNIGVFGDTVKRVP